MKKGLFLLASVAMLMLAGCGESGGVTSASSNELGNTTPANDVVIPDTVGAHEVAVTTPQNLYNISSVMGTPPALPSN